MDGALPSFERFAAERLLQDRDQITREWIGRVSSRLDIAPHLVLPHSELLDDIPVVLAKAAEFLVVPEPQKLTAEQLVTDEMRNIALLRNSQGWGMEEVVREFDELAHILDQFAVRWIDDYPGTPEPRSVGRTFGRLNRVPLLMGQILVGTLEGERKSLLQELAAIEEAERIRLSRELHDQVGQLTTALLLGLKSLERGADAPDQSVKIVELERLADRIARETQQLALDLRPPALENLGLKVALASLAQDWSERTRIDCDFHSRGLDGARFSPEVEIALYRVAQEGLHNVLKHAQASSASLIVERRDHHLLLIVEDDGVGFDPEQLRGLSERSRRLGVRGMRERVAWVGGTLEIESFPGSGTTLYVKIPHATAGARPPAGAPAG